ncbi:MAG: crotonase, partial [Chloroflexota bacterium]
MMGFEFIIYERESGDIGILTINRPNVLNALSWQALHEMRDFFENILSKEDLKTLIVTGAGDRAFAAG